MNSQSELLAEIIEDSETDIKAIKFCLAPNADKAINKIMESWSIVTCPKCGHKFDLLENPCGLFNCPKCKEEL